MPVYLVHGFRWPREGLTGIKIHVIVHNLEDCSTEYVQNAHSQEDLLASFRKLYPDLMKAIEVNGKSLTFVEQYDPENESTSAVSQPYAYVVDKVVELAGRSMTQHEIQGPPEKPSVYTSLLSINVEEVISDGPGLTPQAWEALADLRDKIASGEKIGWWIVYNGDPERAYDTEDEDGPDTEAGGESSTTTTGMSSQSTAATTQGRTAQSQLLATPLPVPSKKSVSSLSTKFLPSRSRAGATLPSPKDEQIPEPPKLKEVAKSSGLRKKFFGKRI